MTHQKGLIIRKLIHLSLGLIIWILSYVVEKNVLLYLIMAGAVFSFLTFNYKKFHLLHKTSCWWEFQAYWLLYVIILLFQEYGKLSNHILLKSIQLIIKLFFSYFYNYFGQAQADCVTITKCIINTEITEGIMM